MAAPRNGPGLSSRAFTANLEVAVRHEQSRKVARAEGHQGREHQVPSSGQNYKALHATLLSIKPL